MPALPECPRTHRSILKISLGVTIAAVVTMLAVVFLIGAPTADAASVCTLTGGPISSPGWTNSSNWSCIPSSTYPGAAGGDTASVGCNTIQVQAAVPNGVILLQNCPSATVDVLTGGQLQIEQSSNLGSGGSILRNSGGTLIINAGSGITFNSGNTVQINGGTTSASGTFTVGGTLNVTAGTFTNSGTMNVTPGTTLTLSGGTFTNNSALNIQSGVGVGGTFTWSGGTLNGTGTTTIQSGSTSGTLSVTAPVTLNGSETLVNAGTSFALNGSAINSTSGSPIINNSGTMTQGAVAATITPTFNNTGTVVIPATGQALVLNGGGTHTGTFNLAQPGTQISFAGAHTFNGGASFSGLGDVAITGGSFLANTTLSIPGKLTNGGSLAFGGATAQGLAVSGNFTQLAGGTLNVRLNGTVAASTYDQVRATGSASLAGTLNATLGYAAADNDSYNVVTYGSNPGPSNFGTKNLPIFPAQYPTGMIVENAPGAAAITLQAVPVADLGVSQTAPPSTLHNQSVTFVVTVKNNGPASASTVTVNDTVAGGTFASASGACTSFPCTIASLGNGATASINVVATASVIGSMTNTVSVTSLTTDTNLVNNTTAIPSVTVAAAADLAISSVSTSANPINAAQSETFTINGVNNGPDPASSAQVNLGLTAGTFTSVSSGAFTCTIAGVCTAPSLPTGTWTITAVATAPPQAGTMTLNAAAGATTGDPVSGNNTGTATVTVNAIADLQMTKALVSPLDAGANVTYTVSVKNAGPSDAAGVSVSDPTPAGLTFVSNSGACSTPYPCNLGTLTAGSVATITTTYSVPSNASGNVTNTASVSATTPDSNAGNNSSTVTTSIIQKADLAVTKTGPANAQPNSNVTFTISVKNNGPSDAASVQLADPTPSGLTFVSASGACTSFPCSIATLPSGQTATTQAIYMVQPGPTTTITNTATATATTPDPNSANNSGSASLLTGCPTSNPGNPVPADGATNVPTAGMLSWSNVGAASYTVYLDVQGPNACTKFFGSTSATSLPYSGLQQGTTYQWRVEAVSSGCPTKTSSCMTFTTTGSCPTTPPVLINPIGGTVTGPVTYSWSPVTGAVDYQLFVNGILVTTTTSTTYGPTTAGSGSVSWYVVAEFIPACVPLQSSTATFNACDTSATPLPSVVGQAASGQALDLSWTAVPGTTNYEVTESKDPSFNGGTTLTTNNTKMHFQHSVTTSTGFYYRVRAFLPCSNGFGPYSLTVRVVVVALPPSTQPNEAVPAGNTDLVPIPVHVPGFPDGTFPFTASVDKPWLVRVDPSSFMLPPEGIDLTVYADPSTLPNGTFTGTVLITPAPSKGSIVPNGVTAVSAPVSVSLVTPVTPQPAGTPPQNALIIPSVGHLDGVNSHWQSDIRVANTSTQNAQYQLTFTPDDISKGVKQTIITVAPGATTALDDIIKTWYGVGALGETANGVLVIQQAGTSGKGSPGAPDAVNVSLTTVASSRTYNVASNGTLGQFIPAVLFSSFVGKAIDANHAATVLGLQQVAQSSAYRTNLGLVEAAGQPVSALVSVFNDAGTKLLDLPVNLQASQQVQINSFLAQNNISLTDGRIEVKAVSGTGKITAYASVVDNSTNDPLLVSGVPLGQLQTTHYVLPGVADLNTGQASWRTDMRVLNPTTTPQFVTLMFVPQVGTGSTQTTSMSVNPGQTLALDSVLANTFGQSNIGGAIHLTTGTTSSLVVTARTYNQTSNGTYGQFVPAVTSADAVGKGDRALQILQAEDSVRYRTNLGIAEVTGNPATVQVSAFLPDSKVSPSATIPLPANGFLQQVGILQAMGLSNVYNVRLSVQVIDGTGKVAAYGSVIDQQTQDPTYVPAQ